MTFINNIRISNPTSQFGELVNTERTPVIELFPQFGLSVLRNTKTEENGATVVDILQNPEIEMSTNTTINANAIVDSSQSCRYIPGYNSQIGLGIRLDSDDPNTYGATQELRWGSFNNTNGFYFSFNQSGFHVNVRKGVSTITIDQSDFNKDPLNGTGPSGLTLDLLDGNIFNIEYTWYGYGIIEFSVILIDNSTIQRKIIMHSLKINNTVSVNNPNLPIRVQVLNGPNTSNESKSLYFAGRQASIVGKFIPLYRITSDYVLGVTDIDTSLVPIISFRRKSDYQGITLNLENVNVLARTQDLIVSIILNGTLTNDNFTTSLNGIDPSETALEKDTSATSITNGNVIYRAFVQNSGRNNSEVASIQELNIDVPDQQTITLAVQTTSGVGGEGDFILSIKEEW